MKRSFWTGGIAALLLITISGCWLKRSVGKNPEGEALARLDSLPNYKNGTFENLAESTDSVIKRNKLLLLLNNRLKITRPPQALPWVKTNLKTLTAPAPTVVWFGHSSVLIETLQGNVLIDPIFSNYAGPIPGVVNAFKGANNYSAKDMPPIDVLIISHDHYDHLDFNTLKKLKDNIKMAVVPMGVGSDLLYWGFDAKKITELNWNQSVTLPGGLQVTATPAQHRSNRTYKSVNKTLWASFVIQVDKYKLYYSGDSGYGTHFKEIGEKYGPFDLALLECGQYSPNWSWTHLWFGQAAQAAVDLKAQLLQPIHWGKFTAADHAWNEPIKKLVPAAEKLGVELNIPRIGEAYTLGDKPKKTPWWNF